VVLLVPVEVADDVVEPLVDFGPKSWPVMTSIGDLNPGVFS